MYQGRSKHTNGFTIVELMLAMSFIAALLIGIAMLTIQVTNIYTKGTTLKLVNQTGRFVSEDIQRTLSSSSPFDTDSNYISDDNSGGRLCMGRYSYIWNYGAALRGDDGVTVYNQYDSEDGIEDAIRLVRVSDPGGGYCEDTSLDIQSSSRPVELLGDSDLELALHSFEVIPLDVTEQDGGMSQQLYTIRFVLGTNEIEALETSDTTRCAPPADDELGSDGRYCAVNEFEITARSGNFAIGG